MKPLVIITARGGSKGVPGKNIKLLADKPLIQYTIEAARKIFSDQIICVSTDDSDIKRFVEKLGLKVPFIRPIELAQDNSSSYDVLIHAVNYYQNTGYKPDVIILLQPTSPFRTSNHIIEAMNLFDEDCEMLVSVKKSKANPYFNLFEQNKYGFLAKSKVGSYKRRQDCPDVYEFNGAIYLFKADVLLAKNINEFTKIRKYEMDEMSSHDIDTELDWKIAELLINKQNERNYK